MTEETQKTIAKGLSAAKAWKLCPICEQSAYNHLRITNDKGAVLVYFHLECIDGIKQLMQKYSKLFSYQKSRFKYENWSEL